MVAFNGFICLQYSKKMNILVLCPFFFFFFLYGIFSFLFCVTSFFFFIFLMKLRFNIFLTEFSLLSGTRNMI